MQPALAPLVSVLLAALAPHATGQAAVPAPEDVILLKLLDSRALWGQIVGHDAERVTFLRLDNGGTVSLPWGLLEPAQAEAFLEQFGYVDRSGEELLVEADRLTLVDGTEVIGKVVTRNERELQVKTSSALFPVPIARLRGVIVPVQVPALDIFTRSELYQNELVNLDPESAESHFELAGHCERILDFEHAVEHYQAARDLDPSFKPAELPQFLARAQLRAENQQQLEHLYAVDSLRARGKFDDALLKLDEFEQLYPENDLAQDVLKKRAQVVKTRAQTLTREVPSAFYAWAQRLTAQAARDPKMTFASALQYVEETLTEDLYAAVHAELQKKLGASVTPDEVRKLWQERKPGRIRKASYGQGTWLLGDDKARAELPERTAPTVETEKDAQRAELEEKVKRYLQNQQMVKRAQASAEKKDEHEAFWATWRSGNRALWLLAYYAEFGGEMQLRKPVHFRNCPDCNGSAVREIINTGSARTGAAGANMQLIQCPLCMGVGVQRRVDFW
jgi:tetratricopeptide (TPR) repeat protein